MSAAISSAISRTSCSGSRADLVICGIDLNGRLPVGFKAVTGAIEYGTPDDTGHKFADIRSEAHPWVPSTNSEFHEGHCATFVRHSGHEHHITLPGRAEDLSHALPNDPDTGIFWG